ncbi:MAG TPA: CRISPR system precrRNA processing endoribonuclease RAMP protein Cas6 [Thermoanaerobaculia bacterium]|nr:CRISPR system precrRNA processing endoribonuclease RAMP protein Cas6 [Thermoanaerobaculia bacterium]
MTEPFPLPALPYLTLEAELVARVPARLPPYKGSLLRGAWGHALRALACQMGPEQVCALCPLRAGCVYPPLFEPVIEGDPLPFLEGLPAAPRAFVFEPEGDQEVFAAGDPLRLRLVLIGRTVALQGHAVLALERMARRGLGAARHPFELAEVTYRGADGAPVAGYDRARRRWTCEAPARLPAVDPAPERAVLRFLTPTRIKAKGHLRERVGFRELVFRQLRRVLELAAVHVPGAEVRWDFEDLLDRAQAVKVRRAEVAWLDWERYSNRLGRKMSLGGFVGEMEVEGDLAPFWPLLRTGEVVHVGKGTTFGLGRMVVEPVRDGLGAVRDGPARMSSRAQGHRPGAEGSLRPPRDVPGQRVT